MARPGDPADRRGRVDPRGRRLGRCRAPSVGRAGHGAGHGDAEHTGGHAGQFRLLGRCARVPRGLGGDDGGDDAAQRHADDRPIRHREPQPVPVRQAGRAAGALCGDLPGGLAGLRRPGVRGRRGRRRPSARRAGLGRPAAVCGGPGAAGRRRVPVQRAQAGLPARLPEPALVPDDPVAQRVRRHAAGGAGPRPLLRGVLLGADGRPGGRGRDGAELGAPDRCRGLRGEAPAARRVDGPARRRRVGHAGPGGPGATRPGARAPWPTDGHGTTRDPM